jgi:hypothetical protein
MMLILLKIEDQVEHLLGLGLPTTTITTYLQEAQQRVVVATNMNFLFIVTATGSGREEQVQDQTMATLF